MSVESYEYEEEQPHMSKRILGAFAAFAVLALALGSVSTASAEETGSREYRVTIENLTDGQPFTPPVLVAHSADMDLFEMGEAASTEIAALAENGNGDPLVALATAAGATVVAHDEPVLPGYTATISISAESGLYL